MGKLLTCYAPFRRSPPEYCYPALPLDLHVLSLPLAFILSQDQTLLCIFYTSSSPLTPLISKEINALVLLFLGTCLYLSFSIINELAPACRKGIAKIYYFFIPTKFFCIFFIIFFKKVDFSAFSVLSGCFYPAFLPVFKPIRPFYPAF